MKGSIPGSNSHTLSEPLGDLASQHPQLNLTGDVVLVDQIVRSGDAYYDVYEGRSLKTGKLFAVKQVRPGGHDIPEEFRVWSSLKHPNILPLLGFILRGSDSFAFISEWTDNGTLRELLREHVEMNIFGMVLAIAAGLQYLHEHQIIHGNINSNNVLISSIGVPMLTGFGGPEVYAAPTPLRRNARWLAPEVISSSHGLNKATDIWAFGMTVYEILTGKFPFEGLSMSLSMRFAIAYGLQPSAPENLSTRPALHQKLWNLCQGCWKRSPFRRPSMAFILEDLDSYFKINILGKSESGVSKSSLINTISNKTMANTSLRPPWCSSVAHLIRGANEALRILGAHAGDFNRIMLEAQVDRYAVQVGFFESEDGMDFSPNLQEISFYIALAVEANALNSLADSLANVAQPVIVSVRTPESDAFAWFDTQGVRVTFRANLPDVLGTIFGQSSAKPDERTILFYAPLPGSHDPNNEADSTRQCPVPSDVSDHRHRSGSTMDADSSTHVTGDGNISSSDNNGNEVPMEADAGGIPAVAIKGVRVNMQDPYRKAFTIRSSSVIDAKIEFHANDVRRTLTDEFAIGLEMTAIWAKRDSGCEMHFELPKILKSTIPDGAPEEVQNNARVHFITTPLDDEDRKPVYYIGTCTLNVCPTLTVERKVWLAAGWKPDVKAKFQPSRTVSQSFNSSLCHTSGGGLGFTHTVIKTRNTHSIRASGKRFKKWVWNTDDEELRQTGHLCEQFMVEFDSTKHDEPQTQVTLTCRRIRNKSFLGEVWEHLRKKVGKPGPIHLGLKNLQHELVLVIDWKMVPPCDLDDAKIPRFPLHIQSDYTISSEPAPPPAFDSEEHPKFPYVKGTQSIVKK